MPTPATPPRHDIVAETLARDRLGVPDVVYFVMSAAAPLTVVAGVVTTGFAVTGVTGIPLAFIAIGLVLALFAVGYVAMARRVENAGAFYAYIAKGLGRPLGVGAAWVALLAYNGLQVGLYGAVGTAARPLLRQWFDVSPPWWVIALVAWALVGCLGLLRVDVNGMVLAILLLTEIGVIVVFDLADLAHPASGTISFEAFAPSSLAVPGVGAVLALAVLGFVGFESAVVYSEESKDPQRTVRYATYTAIALIAGLYSVSAWAMTVVVGTNEIVAAAQEQGPEIMFSLAALHLGDTAMDIGHALFVTSLIAAMISFHGTTARYTFALGRERVLPQRLGKTTPSGAPRAGSLIQSLLGLVVIIVYAVAGWDPLVTLFFYAGTGGGYGVLLLITATAVAIIVYFARYPHGENIWRRRIAPCLAASALFAVVYLATINFDTLLGVAPDSPVRWAIPAVYLGAFLLGVGWGLILKIERPEDYLRIGLGAKAVTVGLMFGLTTSSSPGEPPVPAGQPPVPAGQPPVPAGEPPVPAGQPPAGPPDAPACQPHGPASRHRFPANHGSADQNSADQNSADQNSANHGSRIAWREPTK